MTHRQRTPRRADARYPDLTPPGSSSGSRRRWPPALVATVVVAGMLVAGPRASAASAQTPPPAPIGAAPQVPAHSQVTGDTAPSTALHLSVVLRPGDPAALAAAATAVSTPGTAAYRGFLTPSEFARRFAPAAATVSAVTSSLRSLGLTPGPLSPNGLSIPVTTTAATAESAFGVVLHDLRLANGRVAFANDAAPRLPAAIASAVAGIVGLDNVVTQRPSWQQTGPARRSPAGGVATRPIPANAPQVPGVAGPQACTAATAAATTGNGYTAAQIAKAYSFGGLYNNGILGFGVTIGLVELTSYRSADISAFQACYSTSTSVSNVNVDGGPTDASGDIEAVLDIEGALSMAPQASIVVYQGPNGGSGPLDLMNAIVSADTAKVVSTSWGDCEAAQGAAMATMENTLFQEAALQGQTVLAATADNGSEDCQSANGSTSLSVDDPSSQPFVTGVGGTTLAAVGPAPTERVWNDAAAQLGAGGGGISSFWQLPPAQHGPGVVNSYSTRSTCGAPQGGLCRETPDVSASADPAFGYVIYYAGTATGVSGWQTVGGTSAAAPLWAAVAALANSNCSCNLGFLNTSLYNVAAAGVGAFDDVTIGNNDYLGVHGGTYPATAGYDMASGLGTPVVSILAAQLSPHDQAPVFVNDTPPASGVINVGYHYTFAASGKPAPTFAVAGGNLPAGLSLNVTSGVLSGVPTAIGLSTFTVSATNGVGSAAVTSSISINIGDAPGVPGYTALVPVRICDTRAAGPGVTANQCDSAGHTPLQTGGTMDVTVAGAAGVPANATAVVLHVTTTGTTAASYLTVWPAGQAQPTAANLVWTKGLTVPNLVQVGVGTTGQVSVFNYAGNADVVIDLEGYFTPSSGSLFTALSPVRVCDTRLGVPANQCNNNGTATGTLGAGTIEQVNVTSAFGVPAGATSVALNVTATTTSTASYLTVWPAGAAQPFASSLNWVAGQTISNRAITAVSGAGNIDVFNAFGTTNVVIDLTGYFVPGSGSGYFPITPVRICDTRAAGPGVASNACDSAGPGTLAGGTGFSLGGFNASLTAVVTNVTVTNTMAAGYLTVFPDDAASIPLAADLTWAAHQTIGNLSVADLGSTATLAVFNGSSASTDVVIDAEGYYSPTSPTSAASAVLTPAGRSARR